MQEIHGAQYDPGPHAAAHDPEGFLHFLEVELAYRSSDELFPREPRPEPCYGGTHCPETATVLDDDTTCDYHWLFCHVCHTGLFKGLNWTGCPKCHPTLLKEYA